MLPSVVWDQEEEKDQGDLAVETKPAAGQAESQWGVKSESGPSLLTLPDGQRHGEGCPLYQPLPASLSVHFLFLVHTKLMANLILS